MTTQPTPFNIRPARPSDAAPLAALAARVFAATYGTTISNQILFPYLNQNLSATAVAADLARPETYYHVALDGDTLCGFVKLEETTAPLCVIADRPLEIVRLYVAEQYRRQGVGSQLLEAALITARELAYPAVWLCVWEGNLTAINFCKQLDFQPRGYNNLFVNSVVLHDYVLEKELIYD